MTPLKTAPSQQELLALKLTIKTLKRLQGETERSSDEMGAVSESRDESTTATSSSITPPYYRYGTLSNEFVLINQGRLPNDVRSQLETIFSHEIFSDRRSKILSVARQVSHAVDRTMNQDMGEDEYKEYAWTVINALIELTRGQMLTLVREDQWNPHLKPSLPPPQPRGRPARQPGSYVVFKSFPLTSRSKTLASQRSNVETSRLGSTIGLSNAAINGALSERGVTRSQMNGFLGGLDNEIIPKSMPDGSGVFLPILVTEAGKSLFESENRAATIGSYVIKGLQRLEIKSSWGVRELLPKEPEQEKVPLVFSLTMSGLVVQLSVHYPEMEGDRDYYHMRSLKAYLISDPDQLEELLLKLETILMWAQGEFLTQVADHLSAVCRSGRF